MSTSSLVQIEPLSQSGYEQMACSHGYRAIHVRGMGRAGSTWADLGQEAHRLISEYINHLVETRQSTDYDFFDALTSGAPPEALDGMDRVRETLVIDSEGAGRKERTQRTRPLMFPSPGLGGRLDRPARLISEKQRQRQKHFSTGAGETI